MTRISFAVSEDVGTEILLRDVREEFILEHLPHHVNHNNGADDFHESFYTAVLGDESEKSHTSASAAAASRFSIWSESGLLFNIALPSVAVQLSVVLIFPQTASDVGRHLGTEQLAGFR